MTIIRYFFVGGFGALVDLVIFSIAVRVYQLDWFYPAIASFLVATALNYTLSVIFVFKSGVRFDRRTEIMLVFYASGAALIVNQLILWHLIERLSLDEILSKVLSAGTIFLLNYFIRSRYIFRR
jgi:putative flippase GtrA